MNPRVIVDPPPLDAAIRHDGPAKDRELLTMFAYADDEHDFAQAQRRCVGIGKCRQTSGGVMCPSYQVTREELHSTRGRAHLLWEMLAGGRGHGRLAVDRGTRRARSLPVLQGMPVGLPGQRGHGDVQGRVHPPPLRGSAVGPAAVALVDGLAAAVGPAGRASPRGWSTGSPGCALVKRLGGIAPEREVPIVRAATFTRWFVARGKRTAGLPELRRGAGWCCGRIRSRTGCRRRSGRAAVAVLEAAGFEVVLPDRPVCCGLTWISTGQLGVARRVLAAAR